MRLRKINVLNVRACFSELPSRFNISRCTRQLLIIYGESMNPVW